MSLWSKGPGAGSQAPGTDAQSCVHPVFLSPLAWIPLLVGWLNPRPINVLLRDLARPQPRIIGIEHSEV